MRSWSTSSLFLCLAVMCQAAIAAAAGVPIVEAARVGDTPAVRRLLESGAAVNAPAVDGTTALHWAAHVDDLELARVLIKAGADPNAVNRYGVTPLSAAARHGNAAMLSLLFDSGADMKAADAASGGGQTLLMLAARTGGVDAVRFLIRRGANVNATEPRTGTTAVIWAAAENRAEVIRLLAEAGADVNSRSKLTEYPHTPPAVVGDALEPGVSYVGQTVLPKGSWTAAMYAARQGATQAVRALAEAGADLDAQDPDGTTALIFAIINGHYEAAKVLVEKGANPNVADTTGMTALYAAVDMHTLASTFGRPDPPPSVVAGSVDAIRMLLAAGADPNARLSTRVLKRVHNAGDARLGEGATPFMRAARGGDALVMRILLDAGADPALAQKNGNSPLLLAAGLGADRGGNNPLRGGEIDALAALEICLERGLDINAVNNGGDSALHTALGSPRIIRFLAERGARLDVRDKRGRTPLEAALNAREPHAETIALLQQLTGSTPAREATAAR
jgi:uncharacterized protein